MPTLVLQKYNDRFTFAAMTKRDDLLAAAEAAFEVQGFHAVPVDEVIRKAGVSPRTLYAHFPTKTELALSVLRARHDRFLGGLERALDNEASLAALIDAFADWLSSSPASGCLFLRALGEFDEEQVAEVVAAYRTALRQLVETHFPDRAAEILLILEGATALSPTLGVKAAIAAARNLAGEIET